MTRRAFVDTKTRILDLAEDTVLSFGFGSLNLSELANAADISKNGFLYHFADKTELARAMLQRYVDDGNAIFNATLDRARVLSDDPLDQLLFLLQMIAEHFESLQNGSHPGCLVAASCYHDRLFDEEIRELNRAAILLRRERIRKVIFEVAKIYEPKQDVDLTDLADGLSALIDGGIVLSKTQDTPKPMADQVRVYRSFVELLFRA